MARYQRRFLLGCALIDNGVDSLSLQLPPTRPAVMRRMSSDYGLSSDLWSGADVGADLLFSESPAQDTDAQLQIGTQLMQIMGHYNSGTNLLQELVAKNFPQIAPESDGPATGDCEFWKHSCLRTLKTEHGSTLDTCNSKKVTGIAMIRNPLSWLLSCKRVFYDLHECNKGDDWLRRACTYPPGTPSYLGGKTFDDVEQIWSIWTSDYGSLKQFGFNQSVAIKYEDLVMDTEVQLELIAKVLGVEFSGDVKQVEDAVHPTAVTVEGGRDLAIEKITSKSYLDDFSKQELTDACSRLDRKLMRQYGYDDCDWLFPDESALTIAEAGAAGDADAFFPIEH